VTSAHRVQFSLLLPDMKPWLACDASGILFRVTELKQALRLAYRIPIVQRQEAEQIPSDELRSPVTP
jgi:hypothetical protein